MKTGGNTPEKGTDMRFIDGKLNGTRIIEPQVFGDHRGFFMETWSKAAFAAGGIVCDFVQANQSVSARRGTLRGIHFQRGDNAQAKLVRCLRGAVLDVAVDLRRSSPTYGQWEAVTLSEENRRQFFIPRGFGHGFVTLTDDAAFAYLVDAPYAPEAEGGIAWNDPDIGVDWGCSDPILSDKDRCRPLLRDAVTGFEAW